MSELAAEYGVNAERLNLGANAGWTSPFTDLSPGQLAKVNELVDDTYDLFLGR